jgi:hypothetical protein
MTRRYTYTVVLLLALIHPSLIGSGPLLTSTHCKIYTFDLRIFVFTAFPLSNPFQVGI